MIRICLVGGLGRMGRAIAEAAQAVEDVAIVAVWEHPDIIASHPDYALETKYSRNEVVVTDTGKVAAQGCDVIVDFSSPAVFERVVGVAYELEKPLVTGTTGIESKSSRLEDLARKVAVVDAPNMATGVNVLFKLAEVAGRALGGVADIEIVEAHHRTKKDSPSGTALRLGKILSEITQAEVVSREFAPERGGEIRIHSLRMGSVPGLHSVNFAMEGEVLEIRHTALSRLCFATGAIRAAVFASHASPGLYDMRDVLGLR